MKVRAVSYPRPTIVLFYCLDPRFPGPPHVSALDVDGFLTNSESTQRFLLPAAPTALIPLAVDTEAFPFYPDPPPPAACASGGMAGGERGGGRVVYVGAAGALEFKEMLAWMLREAAPYGLDIYGSGWQDVPEFSGYWRGVLPEGDLVSGWWHRGLRIIVLPVRCRCHCQNKSCVVVDCCVFAGLGFDYTYILVRIDLSTYDVTVPPLTLYSRRHTNDNLRALLFFYILMTGFFFRNVPSFFLSTGRAFAAIDATNLQILFRQKPSRLLSTAKRSL